MENYYPVDVKPLEQYRLLITFDNEERRIFDVTPYLSDSFFSPLRNPAVFQTARVNPLTVEWAGELICVRMNCIATVYWQNNQDMILYLAGTGSHTDLLGL